MSFDVALANERVVEGSVTMPASGIWVASLRLDSDASLSGAVDLTLGDRTLKGTVVEGAAFAGTARYRVVGGKAKWGAEVDARAYASGTSLSTVLRQLAADAGESIDGITDKTVGQWTRRKAPAIRTLRQLLGSAWYIDDAGVTQARARAGGSAEAEVLDHLPGSGFAVAVTDTPSKILPGQSLAVDDETTLTIEDLVVSLSPERLELHVWGTP